MDIVQGFLAKWGEMQNLVLVLPKYKKKEERETDKFNIILVLMLLKFKGKRNWLFVNGIAEIFPQFR